MDTNSDLDSIISRVTSVTKQVIDTDDHNKVLYTYELTPNEYVAEYAGYMYRRYVTGVKGVRLHIVSDQYLGVRKLVTASESNGIKTSYQLHY